MRPPKVPFDPSKFKDSIKAQIGGWTFWKFKKEIFRRGFMYKTF